MTVMVELLGRGPARPDLWEDLLVTDSGVTEMLRRWVSPTPVPREPAGDPLPEVEQVAAHLDAGTPVVVDVRDALPPPGRGTADPGTIWHLADLLIVAAHAGTGFGVGLLPRVDRADQVWALLSGAVAAMTGSDVRAALTAPDPTAIDALGRSAREVIRDVVTAVVLDDGRGDPVADMRLELGSPGAASGDADTGPGGPPDPAVAGD